ncbi:MAG: magnesium transporter CorA family protein [Turicibacter sp.]|nr:magnesium transporter CorA family protein [Turicibacter sp.]
MISYYLSDAQGNLKTTRQLDKHCWINMINPTHDEINSVSTELDIPLDFIVDALDNYERSRIERDDDKVLIIVDIPIVEKGDQQKDIFDTIPLGMIVTEHHFITVCLRSTQILDNFIHNRVRGFQTNMKTRFALQILLSIATFYLRDLRLLNKKSEEAEISLHQSISNEQLFDIMNVEKSLIYLLTSLKSNRIVLEKLTRQKFLKIYEEDDDLLEDVIIEMNQAIEMAEVQSNVLGGMMDAYASIISNNVNDIMKFLTLITIILTVPTLVFSFYGMNVALPYESTPGAWLLTIAISLFFSLFLAWFLWKRKLF